MAKKTATKTRKRTAPASTWPQYELRFDPDELRAHLKIDKHSLDTEVEQQPELFGEVADAAAQAKSQADSLTEELKEFEANLDKQARTDAANAEDRITENEIKALIAGDKDRKALVIRLLEVQNVQRRLDALTTAFRHRSYAMRDMVDLFLASYYSSRSAAGSREDHRDAEVDRITGRMSDRRKKRTSRNRTRSQ